MSSDFADAVAKLCYEKFKKLPNATKLLCQKDNPKEWTHLAGIVLSFEDPDKNMEVISLSTGTKCLGYDQLTENGEVVFDSHAEVLARRAFLRYMYFNILLVLKRLRSKVVMYDRVTEKIKMKPGIKFHFFISHVPCGDAAIFPKQTTEKHSLSSDFDVKGTKERNVKKVKKEESGKIDVADKCSETSNILSKAESQESDLGVTITNKNIVKKVEKEEISIVDKYCETLDNSSKAESKEELKDIYRTGAKCVEKGLQDPKEAGVNYHVIGALRTKPGRGSPTWSMSCSDKIARWNICGIQGALLSLILSEPVYLSSITFGKCPFNKEAVERAVMGRLTTLSDLPPSYKINKPDILQSSIPFEFSQEVIIKNIREAGEPKKIIPCPASVTWCDIHSNSETVIVGGRNQGVTKKDWSKKAATSELSKAALFLHFIGVCRFSMLGSRSLNINTEDDKTYLDFKQSSEAYQLAKKKVLSVFSGWKKKPDRFQQFTCKTSLNNCNGEWGILEHVLLFRL